MLSLKSKYRTHTCGELNSANVGETVTLSGWVHRKRDHGALLFVDLRDNYGITQVVFDGGDENLEKVRPESVIKITGTVVARDASAVNEKIPTGGIEIQATSFEVLTNSDVLPFQVFGDDESVAEEANKMIAAYSTHTPAIEELFFLGYKKGDQVTVGGIINETTTIR